MTYSPLEGLIDKTDNFELIGLQIAAILANESANQQALATAAGKDPALWKLNVYHERIDPWEQFLIPEDPDPTPIVNIWFDNSNFPEGKGNTVERQTSETIYNIDHYGYAISQDDEGSGHIAGDAASAYEAQRCLRLSRNILMAGKNSHLQLLGLVGIRWPQSIAQFQPTQDGRQVQRITAIRLALRVQFNEFSPQLTGKPLEVNFIDVKRALDGQVLISAAYDYTA